MKHVLKRLYIFMDQSMFKIVIGINMKWIADTLYLFGKKVARLEIFTYRRLKLLYQDSAKVEAMTLFVQADLKISIPV